MLTNNCWNYEIVSTILIFYLRKIVEKYTPVHLSVNKFMYEGKHSGENLVNPVYCKNTKFAEQSQRSIDIIAIWLGR